MNDLLAVEILLVEDRDEDAELTLRALRKGRLANNIHRVCDGEEALEFLFREGRYAERPPGRLRVVLLDLKLPKLDGLEVLRRLRRHPESQLTPVVVLTSSAEERDIIESYRLGVNSYVVKPVAFQAFYEAIQQLGLYWAVLNRVP